MRIHHDNSTFFTGPISKYKGAKEPSLYCVFFRTAPEILIIAKHKRALFV